SVETRSCGGGFRDSEKQELLGAGSPADSVRLLECAFEIISGKAAQLVKVDMLVVLVVEQVQGKLASAAALAGFQDHRRPDSLRPRAAIRSRCMAWISAQAASSSFSVS